MRKTRKQLEAENANMRSILGAVYCMIFVTEASLTRGVFGIKVVWANRTTYDITGISPAKAASPDFDLRKELLFPDDYKLPENSFRFHLCPGNQDMPFGGTYRFKNKDGEYIWGLGFSKVLKLDDNSVSGQFVNCLTPITEPLQLLEQIEMLIKEYKRNANEPAISEITHAEMNVLELILHGLTDKEIGAKLNISEHTVRTHKDNMMQDLSLHSTCALACFAFKTGIY